MSCAIRAIRSETDYMAALTRIDELMDAEPDTPDGNELDVLTDLVELYEEKHMPMGYPSPIASGSASCTSSLTSGLRVGSFPGCLADE